MTVSRAVAMAVTFGSGLSRWLGSPCQRSAFGGFHVESGSGSRAPEPPVVNDAYLPTPCVVHPEQVREY